MEIQVLISPEAGSDLDEAAEFYEAQETGLGAEVYAFLRHCLLELSHTAGIHPQKKSVHRLPVAGRFPYYAVYYRYNAGVATIMAIIDSRRDPAFNKKRLNSRL